MPSRTSASEEIQAVEGRPEARRRRMPLPGIEPAIIGVAHARVSAFVKDPCNPAHPGPRDGRTGRGDIAEPMPTRKSGGYVAYRRSPAHDPGGNPRSAGESRSGRAPQRAAASGQGLSRSGRARHPLWLANPVHPSDIEEQPRAIASVAGDRGEGRRRSDESLFAARDGASPRSGDPSSFLLAAQVTTFAPVSPRPRRLAVEVDHGTLASACGHRRKLRPRPLRRAAGLGRRMVLMRSPDQERRVVMGALQPLTASAATGSTAAESLWTSPQTSPTSPTPAGRRRARTRRSSTSRSKAGAPRSCPRSAATLTVEESCAMARYLRTFVPGTEVSRPDVGRAAPRPGTAATATR